MKPIHIYGLTDPAGLVWWGREARSHGEWFRPTADLLAYIQSLPDNQDTGMKQDRWNVRRTRWNRRSGAGSEYWPRLAIECTQ
jgi:hypothetical protein